MSAWQTQAPEYPCDQVPVLSIYRNNNPFVNSHNNLLFKHKLCRA